MSSSAHVGNWPRPREALLAALVIVSMGGLAACSSSSDTTTHPLVIGTGMTPAEMGRSGSSSVAPDGAACAQHMPADILSAEQAVVEFDRGRVCLAYVTVRPGTPVSWHNTDDIGHQVTLQTESGGEVAKLVVPAGGTIQKSLPDAGIYRFKLSSTPSFTGTVEVKAP